MDAGQKHFLRLLKRDGPVKADAYIFGNTEIQRLFQELVQDEYVDAFNSPDTGAASYRISEKGLIALDILTQP